MHEGNRHAALAHGGRHALDGTEPHVPARERARHTRFEQAGLAAARPASSLHDVVAGQHVAPAIAGGFGRQPSRLRIGADEDKETAAIVPAYRGARVVDRVVQTTGSISESSRKVVEIIGVTDRIALQTNTRSRSAPQCRRAQKAILDNTHGRAGLDRDSSADHRQRGAVPVGSGAACREPQAGTPEARECAATSAARANGLRPLPLRLYAKKVSKAAAKGHQRDYAYYRCVGTDAYRFGGQRICDNQ
jgi:hypothetical protein